MKISSHFVSKKVNVSAEEAWEIIGAVGGVEKWFAPVITASKVDGDKRYCSTEAGEFSEDIIEVNHESRILKYAIPEQPLMPVSNILGNMAVIDEGGGNSTIRWEWLFEVEIEKEAEAKKMLAEAGEMGISGIEKLAVSRRKEVA